MQKIVVSRSWREFGKQQIVAIKNLVEVFPPDEYELDFHICVNQPSDSFYYEQLAYSKLLPKVSNLTLYSTDFLDNYAKERGADKIQLDSFKEWKWIYHILLYHYLYHVVGETYILSYDDDIFFNGDIKEVKEHIQRSTPFCIGDQYSDSDKPLIGKLSRFFGEWIVDEYYASYGSLYSSNSGFMGIDIESIFKNFNRGSGFFEMLDMFVYKKYTHGENKSWDEYKILLQEQSFLGILNRALTQRKHIVLTEEYGYSVDKIESSKVQHYVGIKKESEKFRELIEEKYQKIINE